MELTQATRSQMTPAERQQVVSLYLAGTKIADIRSSTGRGTSAIYGTLTREGVERRYESSGTLRAFCEVCGKPVGYVSPARREAEGVGRYCSSACMGEAKRLPPEQCGTNVKELLCTKCKEVKPVAEFYPHAKIARGYQYWCRDCTHLERIERAKIPVDPNVRRRHALWSMYRLTVAQYDAMYEQQGGRCAICGVPKDSWEPGVGVAGRDRFLVVDHCHVNGHVRGLLCGNCNHGIGKFKENPENLLAAIAYLRR